MNFIIAALLIAQGVPQRGVERIFSFRQQYLGAAFNTAIYVCKKPEDLRWCAESKRTYTSKIITVKNHDWAVYIDFKRPSHTKRLWLMNLSTGQVEHQYVAHGSGSSKTAEPERFSNRRNSKMTSLGIYLTGDAYKSSNHGVAMKLYGLEKSNSNAYVRDVIFHGARYTNERYALKGKLDESHGCPAVDREFAERAIPLLKNGAIIFHDHADLLDAAMSGEEVWTNK